MIYDSILGPHEEIITARTSDHNVLNKSQDGGIVSSLLIYALENNIIDGTLVAGDSDTPWMPEPKVATTKKDILKAAGTKYTMCPNISLLKDAAHEYGLEKIGTVGTPCQVMGIRKLQTYPLGGRNVTDKIALVVGIYCMENFPYESIKTFIAETAGVSPAQVTKMDINKGKLIISHNGKEDKLPLKKTHGYEQAGCSYCLDYVSELSDFSCGSVGAKDGWSTIIKRTSKGSQLIDQAIADGVLEVTETDEGEYGVGMLRKLATNKKEKDQKRIDKKINYGINMPFEHSKNKSDVYENR
ncbi:MAG: coenzyme F420 hydrogenase subunit beta [Methanosphaera sp.]|nr:coenzyme F420 hydrogenase subunit beta [Methanosphaera sp.]